MTLTIPLVNPDTEKTLSNSEGFQEVAGERVGLWSCFRFLDSYCSRGDFK